MKKVILIVVLVLIVAAGGYFAYVKFVKKGSVGLPGTSVSTTKCDYDDKDLCKFLTNWKEQKYYTANSTNTDKSGNRSTSVYKSVGDDKTQMIYTVAGKESYNTIIIGDTTYTKDYTDNKWWKQTAKPSQNTDIATEEQKFDFGETTEAQKPTYKKIGTEVCGSFTCFKYQVIDPANTESTEYLYFDNKEYQLRKMRIELKDGTITESTFDYSKITIEAPSPTKEGNPFDIPEITP